MMSAVGNIAVRRIISGGQTGVDRAALDFALENDFATGGYVPKCRQAEDGRIPDKYPNLTETESEDPAERNKLNVRLADATIIISQGMLAGGSKLTMEFAGRYQKPFLHLDLSALPREKAIKHAKDWLTATAPETLNIAGPRASEDEQIYAKTKQFLTALFDK